MKFYTAVLAILFVFACKSQDPIVIPPNPNPSRPGSNQDTDEEKIIPAIVVEMPVYNQPEETGPASPPVSAGTVLVSAKNTQLEVKPKQENYRGGAVVYPYLTNHVYQIFTAIEQLTNIQLEPGEQLVSPPASGNTEIFEVQFSYSLENGKQRAQIYIMPFVSGKQTTLFINTSKRTYSFMLYSYSTTFMPLVSFSYPMTVQEQMKQRQENAATDILLSGSITSLDFGYDIIPHSPHKPRWMPSIVFNDGVKTYINFPSASRASYAPVLFEINSKGERVIVNYRVKGAYYIVDRVLLRAELVLDVNEGNIITIQRTN